MYDLLPLFLIFVSLLIIIIILVRKFPVLASLDLNTIQSEKEAQFKEQIIGNRLKRNIIRYSSKTFKFLKPIGLWIVELWKSAHKKLIDFKENYNKHEGPVVISGSIDLMIEKAEELVRDEKYDEAEKKYIEIISLDSQNLSAFKGLGRLYSEKKQYTEAKQTFEHVLRLLEHDESMHVAENGDGAGKKADNSYISSIYFELAGVSRDNGELNSALTNIIRATEIEPNNPRYLDMKLEISIMNKDKGIALDTLSKLKEVNPENGKIGEFEERVRAM